MASKLTTIIATIDRATLRLGRSIALLNVAMVIAMCMVVLLRYAFNNSSIVLQESVMYIHAIIFMLCMGYTLKSDEHVRVDIIYQKLSEKQKACINLFGSLVLLFPLLIFISWFSAPYIKSTWAIFEVSQEAAGLPYVYLLKSLIIAMTATLGLQGAAEVLRNIEIIMNPPKDMTQPQTDTHQGQI